MNKYNELKNFIDNFVEKNIHHFVDKDVKNVKNALKDIDNDKKILIDQIKSILRKLKMYIQYGNRKKNKNKKVFLWNYSVYNSA